MTDDREHRKLTFLFEYTKFHIAMYVTLISAVLALVGLDALKGCAIIVMQWPLTGGLIGFTMAGMFGSLVASSIPMTNKYTYRDFMSERVGPARQRWITVENAIYSEHICFWFAVSLLLAGAILTLFPALVIWDQNTLNNCRSVA